MAKKPQTVQKTFVYLTKAMLVEVARKGPEWDYNRQLSLAVADLPDDIYVVTLHFPHHHRRMQPCPTHMRCVAEGRRGEFLILGVFQRFPSRTVRVPKGKAA
jgi:hypothetical protein